MSDEPVVQAINRVIGGAKLVLEVLSERAATGNESFKVEISSAEVTDKAIEDGITAFTEVYPHLAAHPFVDEADSAAIQISVAPRRGLSGLLHSLGIS